MLDKMKGLYKLKKQADELKKKMQLITVEVEEKNIHIVMRGDNNVESISINGEENLDIKRAFNRALKETQKKVAKKFQGDLAGFDFPGM